MFQRMNGKQLAGWGYGMIWTSLLFELINSIVAAKVPAPNNMTIYVCGLFVTLSMLGCGIRMMTLIKHRPW